MALSGRQFVAEIRALTDARAKLDRYARHLVDTHAGNVTDHRPLPAL